MFLNIPDEIHLAIIDQFGDVSDLLNVAVAHSRLTELYTEARWERLKVDVRGPLYHKNLKYTRFLSAVLGYGPIESQVEFVRQIGNKFPNLSKLRLAIEPGSYPTVDVGSIVEVIAKSVPASAELLLNYVENNTVCNLTAFTNLKVVSLNLSNNASLELPVTTEKLDLVLTQFPLAVTTADLRRVLSKLTTVRWLRVGCLHGYDANGKGVEHRNDWLPSCVEYLMLDWFDKKSIEDTRVCVSSNTLKELTLHETAVSDMVLPGLKRLNIGPNEVQIGGGKINLDNLRVLSTLIRIIPDNTDTHTLNIGQLKNNLDVAYVYIKNLSRRNNIDMKEYEILNHPMVLSSRKVVVLVDVHESLKLQAQQELNLWKAQYSNQAMECKFAKLTDDYTGLKNVESIFFEDKNLY